MSNSIIAVVGVSAVRFWLDYSQRINYRSYSYKTCERVSLPNDYITKTTPGYIKTVAGSLGLGMPLNVMVSTPSNRHSTKAVRFSLKPKALPDKSFVRLQPHQLPAELCKTNTDIYIASPEYCFLSFANRLSLPALVQLGCNLCAGYAYDANANLSQVFRPQITSSTSIANYVFAARGSAGHQRSVRAVRFVCDNSNSPMETKLAVMSVLPYSEGGYGLGRPQLNKDIILSKTAAESLGRDSCCCDLVWNDEHVAMEYDSNLTHLDKDQHGYDIDKANALSNSGYHLISITSKGVCNFAAAENTFEMVRQLLGRRSRNAILKKNLKKRQNVYHELFVADAFYAEVTQK